MFDFKEYIKKSSENILSITSHESEITQICKELTSCSQNLKKFWLQAMEVRVRILSIL